MPDNPGKGPSGEEVDEPEHTVTASTAEARAARAPELVPGAVLDGRYQIEAVIGRGGSGTVFRAWDRVLGEPIAIKVLHADRAREGSWIKRLAREVKVARAIRHPNVCRVFELGRADGQWFVTMELAAAGSLRDLLREARGAAVRPLAERLADARALCAGLAAIHAVGIIHRDVTPQNVLRMAEGRLVLSDFGLAIDKTDETTIHGGTPSYMPPETAMGERAEQRSDVWQLGAILHELLFGRRPEWERAADAVTMKWPLPADASPVDEELARLCRDCLAQNPAARPPTAMAVAGRLAAAEVAHPRTPVERAWLRASALGRRARWPAAALGALLVLAAGARAVQVAARPPLCRASHERLAGIWDAGTKAIVRQAFASSGRSYAGEAFANVSHTLERYLAGWAGMYREACEATHVRGEQSAEILDLRMACLHDRLEGARALAELLTRADGAVVDNAVDAANALGTLERCADARLLRAVLPPPEDAAARKQVERLRTRLAEAKAVYDAGNAKLAAERAKAVVAAARDVGYGPVLAEALELLGRVDTDLGDSGAAQAALKEAFWQAEAARHDEVRAMAATYLVLTSARTEPAQADDWASEADATLKRIGGNDRTRSWLESHLGELRRVQGRDDEALVHLGRAVELKERSGAGRGDVGISLNNMAAVLQDMGRLKEAGATFERAIADLGSELGAEHPMVAALVSNDGEVLARLGRQTEARAAFERALAIEERSFGKDSTNLAYPLEGLGESHLADHQPAAAVAPLERALRIREAHESNRSLVAESAFALGRALWDAGRDRARAESLAEQARAIYAGQPALAARLADVERWLAGPRSRDAVTAAR